MWRFFMIISFVFIIVDAVACSQAIPAPQQESQAGVEAAQVDQGFQQLSNAEPEFGFTERAVDFENNGQKIVGTLTLPEGKQNSYPVILLFHGFLGFQDGVPIIGTEDGMLSRTARLLAEHGYATLRISFRGSGESDGLWEDTTFSGQISDAVAAVDYLTTLDNIDLKRIGVIGLSQGGLVASSAAAQDERIKSVVLWSPVANPVDTYKLLLGEDKIVEGLASDGESIDITVVWGAEIKLKTPFFEDIYHVDPVAAITQVEDPLMVIVGLKDPIVTPQPYYGQVYLNYHEGDEMLIELDGDHIFDIRTEAGPTVFDDAIYWSIAWMQETLKPFTWKNRCCRAREL